MYYKYFKRKENNPGFLLCVSNSRSKTFYCLGATPMVYSVNVWSQALTGDKVMTSRLWFFTQKAKHGLEMMITWLTFTFVFKNFTKRHFLSPLLITKLVWCYFQSNGNKFVMNNLLKNSKKIWYNCFLISMPFFFSENRFQMVLRFYKNALGSILSLSYQF